MQMLVLVALIFHFSALSYHSSSSNSQHGELIFSSDDVNGSLLHAEDGDGQEQCPLINELNGAIRDFAQSKLPQVSKFSYGSDPAPCIIELYESAAGILLVL